jgi:hypothetical protein
MVNPQQATSIEEAQWQEWTIVKKQRRSPKPTRQPSPKKNPLQLSNTSSSTLDQTRIATLEKEVSLQAQLNKNNNSSNFSLGIEVSQEKSNTFVSSNDK